MSRKIVKSLLDTDLYKLTMQWAVLALHPNAMAKYSFFNRRKENKFTSEFVDALLEQMNLMKQLSLSHAERKFLITTCPFLPPSYIEYLTNYRYDPEEVSVDCDVDGNLSIDIAGPWHRTILWEVPLMAMISELYFQHIEKDWKWNKVDQLQRALDKRGNLEKGNCYYAEFGTRRRRSFSSQQTAVGAQLGSNNFIGTSNVFLAMEFGVRAIGTMAHEWMQGISALVGLRHANLFGMNAWSKVYRSNLGIVLPDTFGSDAFFGDFDLYHAKLWDGLRHDSGCPFGFKDRSVSHYQNLDIDPLSKTIVFSDGLNDEKACEIQSSCNGEIKNSFGIGTFFSNDFPDSYALNMVIKLVEMDKIPVVKLSNDIGKQIGHPDALAVANWTFRGMSIK